MTGNICGTALLFVIGPMAIKVNIATADASLNGQGGASLSTLCIPKGHYGDAFLC